MMMYENRFDSINNGNRNLRDHLIVIHNQVINSKE